MAKSLISTQAFQIGETGNDINPPFDFSAFTVQEMDRISLVQFQFSNRSITYKKDLEKASLIPLFMVMKEEKKRSCNLGQEYQTLGNDLPFTGRGENITSLTTFFAGLI
ncbi:hypothetical protein OUZ56_016033 [Daphnia magna]|uniref:Uncharacterized protein n=1 Tax=Daphnia magna TaxID=35525 RepID=A0ABR0APH0_9CRUS|nr:hypothetical protein OUZ56_016033 [Daphnia magna]